MTQVQLDHELKVIRNSVNKRDKIVLVYGNFLVVHPGHLRLLKFAKQYGDRLVVAVIAGSTKDRFPLLKSESIPLDLSTLLMM